MQHHASTHSSHHVSVAGGAQPALLYPVSMTSPTMVCQTTVVGTAPQERANHCLWGVLTFVTGGLFLPCWFMDCIIRGA